VVLDRARHPMVGADVIVVGTPFRAVTDEHGHFVLVNLPPGAYQLQVDGSLAVGGPFPKTTVRIVATDGEQTLGPVGLPVEGSGNNQHGEPGEVLPEPLVVRLEDQFGKPLAGQPITATIIEGAGEFVAGDTQVGIGVTQTATSDDQGEARFVLRVGADEVN